jgi:hypothetical protein
LKHNVEKTDFFTVPDDTSSVLNNDVAFLSSSSADQLACHQQHGHISTFAIIIHCGQ